MVSSCNRAKRLSFTTPAKVEPKKTPSTKLVKSKTKNVSSPLKKGTRGHIGDYGRR